MTEVSPVKVVKVPFIEKENRLKAKKVALIWKCPECGKTLNEPNKVRIYGERDVVLVDSWDSRCEHHTPICAMKRCNMKELIAYYERYITPENLSMQLFKPEMATKQEIVDRLYEKQLYDQVVKKAYENN